MQTSLFDYDLPRHLIAQTPAEPRDSSRLLVLQRTSGAMEHRRFREIGAYLRDGDLLVANDSRVLPARLHGRKSSGGKIEILLMKPLDNDARTWACLTRGHRIVMGTHITVQSDKDKTGPAVTAEVIGLEVSGERLVRFGAPILPMLDKLGEIPLPPYIAAYRGDRERYQTVYSQAEGSAAAPTAGLHFTPDLLIELREHGIGFDTVTLHVGLDTFQPVTAATIEDHRIHSEWAQLGEATARHINETALRGRRVIAVGTTTVRTLEWAATQAQGIDPYTGPTCPWQRTAAFVGNVNLFIRPGYRFRAVDALITNFHLPQSSLLMLVSAFVGQAHLDDPDAGRRIVLAAYEEAKRNDYRFFSFGDAMLIV